MFDYGPLYKTIAMIREYIYKTISEKSCSPQEIKEILTSELHPGKQEWRKFLEILLLALGVGFIISGVIFFFAYNWNQIGNILKIGIPGILLILATLLALSDKLKPVVRQILLTGAALLVGALFAVYGQVYQTGADAWELFLTWAICITAWAAASRFLPLWMLLLVLLNTSLYLWGQEQYMPVFILLSILNGCALLVIELLCVRNRFNVRPSWFINTLGIATASTIFVSSLKQLDRWDGTESGIIWLIIAVLLISGITYGIKRKHLMYVGTGGFCCLLILASALLIHTDEQYLFIGLILAFGTAGLAWLLIKLKKEWTNGNK